MSETVNLNDEPILESPAATGRGMSSLPQEIMDYIIDYAQDSRSALWTCSLTCKSWVPRSSRHLLRRVVIYGDDLGDFARSHARFSECVVKLTIVLDRKRTVLPPVAFADAKPFLLLHDLILSLPRLSDFRVRLDYGVWPHLPVLLNTQRRISGLEVRGCPSAALERILGLFKETGCLQIADGGNNLSSSSRNLGVGVDEQINPVRRHIVRTLHLGVGCDPSMLTGLRDMLDLERLSILSIYGRTAADVVEETEVDMAFGMLGAHIKQLDYRHSSRFKGSEGTH